MDGQPCPLRLVAVCLLVWLLVRGHAGFASATEHDNYVCPGAFELFNSTCYRLVADSPTDGVSARTACQANLTGSHLVYIKSEGVQTFLESKADASVGYWIGLTFTKDKSNPHWLDGTALGDYTNWEAGDAFNENSPCVRLNSDSTPRHQWNDRGCGRLFGYICQIEASIVNTTPPVPTATSCDPEMHSRGASGHYYVEGAANMAAPADVYLIATLRAPSLVRCAAGCTRQADCQSFSYRPAGEGAPASAGVGNCRLHSGTFSAGQLTDQSGYRYYRP